MEDSELSEGDTKKPVNVDLKHHPCLICTEPGDYNPKEAEIDHETRRQLILEFEDNEKAFTLLCKSLKIRLTKKCAWDFRRESLPFCRFCLERSKQLVDIQEQIRDLERQYEKKVEDLRDLILQSKSKELIDSDDGDERFLFFRRQVFGNKVRPKRTTGSKSVEQKCKEEEPITDRRKSSRLSKPIQKVVPDLSKSADNFQLEDLEFSDFVTEVEVGSFDTKSELPIREESQFDFEFSEQIQSPLPEICAFTPLRRNTKLTPKEKLETEKSEKLEPEKSANGKRKKSVPEPEIKQPAKNNRKKPKRSISPKEIGSNDSSDTLDYNPSTETSNDENEVDESQLPEERTKYGKGICKWKTCNRTGQLWYDGIEIISIDAGLQCGECGEVTPIEGDKIWANKSRMKRHIICKHVEKVSCSICSKVLSSNRALEQHIKAVHEKALKVLCNICEKPFTSKRPMIRHAWSHLNEDEKQAAIAAGKSPISRKDGDQLQCGICGKLCKGLYVLRKHEQVHIHQSERQKHMCQTCGGLFSAPETLRSHIKRQHENNNRLQWPQCTYPNCNKKFPAKSQLTQHIRTHTGEKPYKCPEPGCDAGFNTPRLLRAHQLRHQNIRPHKCNSCDMSFYQRDHLRRHTAAYHENPNPPTKKPYRSDNGTRKIPQRNRNSNTSETPEPISTSTYSNNSANNNTSTNDSSVVNSDSIEEPPRLLIIEGDFNVLEDQSDFNFQSSTLFIYPFNIY